MTARAPGAEGSSGEPSASRVALSPGLRRGLPRRDPEAMTAFYEAYFDRIYAFVRRMVGREQLAEDLTQDVFMQLQQSISTYDPERELDPWVFTIASNKVRDFWRSRRHELETREVRLPEEGEGGDPAESKAGPPSRPLEERELAEILERAVEGLPESMKPALVLRSDGLSFAEIAQVLDRSEEAVRKRYSRALEELRRVLSKHPAFQGGGGA